MSPRSPPTSPPPHPAPHPHPHTHLQIFSFSTAITLKIRSWSPKCNKFCYVPIIYPLKFGKKATTGSQDTVQTRKCDNDARADANANADGNDNWICTKINMSPSPLVGGHKYWDIKTYYHTCPKI